MANDTPQILQDTFTEALNANDAIAAAACYTDDAISFPVDDMAGVGREYIRASWEGLFSAMRISGVELKDQHLEEHGDTAIAWGLFSMTDTPHDGGDPVLMEGRYMDVARRIDGHWLYAADHASLPAPPEE
jgi:uncharacterized protein (TIGR02246 family)